MSFFSGSSGNRQQRQVIEIQLLSGEELQQQGAVRPSWVDWLENEKGHEKICSIDRAVGSIRLLELRDNLELTVRTDVAIASKRRPSLPLLPRGQLLVSLRECENEVVSWLIDSNLESTKAKSFPSLTTRYQSHRNR